MMKQNLIMLAESMAKAFDQEWIINIRSTIKRTCEELILSLNNR